MKVGKVLVSRVVSVFDGDTFRCDIDTWPKLFGWRIPIRIRGIDCPERRSKYQPIAERALLARDFTKTALINAKRIELIDVKRGKYFRLIADVNIDGQDLASALLQHGLAVPAKYN